MNLIRQEKIKQYIENKGVVTIKELQALIPDVSLMTIHRDLNALEEQGDVVKCRGGVRSIRSREDVDFDVRMRENNQGKILMVKKALKLIGPRSSVFLDAGTTNILLAKMMPDINVHLITTGPGIALELCKLQNPTVTVCGGTLNRKNLAIAGQSTLDMLDKMNIDTAFIGVSGCSAEAGFTCGKEEDMRIKQLVVQKARVKVVMCTAEKLKWIMPYTFAALKDVDYIITDEAVPEEFVKVAKEAGVRVL